MLCKRIIPCLDIKNGRTVKGINFINLRDAGDPVELAKFYSENGADELCFLDITATLENRKTFKELVKKIANEVNIPFTVGGGIKSAEDVYDLLDSGADKVSINSSAVLNPKLIDELALRFGSQCVVLACDSKKGKVFTHGGTSLTPKNTIDWVTEAVDRGAGEILLTSMDTDGTKKGFDIFLTRSISEKVSVPVIASGGAGKKEDFVEVFSSGKADAALAASIFHYGEIKIGDLKNYLNKFGISVRM